MAAAATMEEDGTDAILAHEESPPDTGMTLVRDGELTPAGERRDRYEAVRSTGGTDMRVDGDSIPPASASSNAMDEHSPLAADVAMADGRSQGRNSRKRRHQKWAVSIQQQTIRPTSCKDCGIVFSAGEVRASTWGSRSTSRWCCLGCVSRRAAVTDDIEPVGPATEEHKAAMESAVRREAEATIAPIMPEGPGPQLPDVTQQAWQQNRLPNRRWFDGLSWESLLTIGTNTYIQIPDRFRGAVLTARRRCLELLDAATDQGADTTAEWKLTLLFDSLLLGTTRSGASCAELLEERLAWFWGGQWAELWADAAGRPPPPTQRTHTDKQRATRVHTLAAAGERSRALAAAVSPKLAARTRDTHDKLRDCFPPRSSQAPWHPVPPPTPTDDFRTAVANEARKLLRRPPRLTAPGLLGTRLEHLQHCTDDPDTLELLVKVLVMIAFGRLPDVVLQALRSGELVATEKGDGDVRPLLVGSTLRRLALRALARARREQLSEACGPNQYGVGRKGGANLLLKCLKAQVEKRPDAAVLKVDLKTAFQKMEREEAFQAMADAVPDVEPALRTWYSGQATHFWKDAAGRYEKVPSTAGFDQGCPLAAAGFSVGQRTPLDNFLEQLQRLDPLARLYSYLDDTYVVLNKSLAALALTGLSKALEPLGLALNPAKTKVWSPTGPNGLPVEMLPHYTQTLPVLGSHLKAPGDTDDAPAYLGQAGSALGDATVRLQKLWDALQALWNAGLKRQAVASLLTTYAGAASQHALQLQLCSEQDAKSYDTLLETAWEKLGGRPLHDTAKLRLGLPTRLMGAGVQWAGTRRHAAFWAGWTAHADEVRKDAGHETIADLLQALPETASQLREARRGLAEQGAPAEDGAALADALGAHRKQRVYLAVVHKKAAATHHQQLNERDKACLHGAGGPGAGAFLGYPEDASCTLEDELWATALRQRVGLSRAEHSQATYPTARTTCALRTAAGVTCGGPLDEAGFHGTTCQSGGGVLKRHTRLEGAVAGLIKRWTQQTPLTEQRVPAWDRERETDGGRRWTERAVLDIEYTDGSSRRWIDVTVRHPAAGSPSERHQAARRAGEAARRAEREKHQRYPGDSLTAFAVETYGRVGAEARQWLLRLCRELPEDMQTAELTRAYKVISCAVQAELALQLRRASDLK